MIIKSFNYVYFIIVLFFIGLIFLLTKLLKNKTQKTKDTVMLSIGSFNILLFILFKYSVSKCVDDFNIWRELPFHLCNINMILFIFIIIFKNKFIINFSFYIAPLGALMAITFPLPIYINTNIFLFKNIGFYCTHGILIVMGVLLGTLGYIKISYKDIFILLPTMIVLSFSAFLFNIFLYNVTGVATNYFYTMYTDNVGLLNFFWSLLPIKYIYLIPAILILTIYVFIVNFCVKLFERIKVKNFIKSKKS